MKAAAILVLGPPVPTYSFTESGKEQALDCSAALAGIPLPCVEVLGATNLQRMMQRFAQAGVDSFTILTDAGLLKTIKLANVMPGWLLNIRSFQGTADIWPSIQECLENNFAGQTDIVYLMKLGAYVEFEPSDVLQFSERHGGAALRVNDRLGPVGLWLVNQSANLEAIEKEFSGREQDSSIKTYFFDGYVNRLSKIHDLRRFVTDVFQQRCSVHPEGNEVRANVWIDEGAQVHKQARIVPPAYVGKNSKIGPASLITRSSSIERDCNVEYGTVIEDSTILASTYIGTGLDVTHSIVCGNTLVHLQQNLVMEINDEILIGTNVSSKFREVFRRHDKKAPARTPARQDTHQIHGKVFL